MDEKLKQPKESLNYFHRRSYLLRLWYMEEPGASDWRATLEDLHTGERFGFASLEQLFSFLIELNERDTGSCPQS